MGEWASYVTTAVRCTFIQTARPPLVVRTRLPYQSAHGELASAVSQVGAPSVRDLAHETRGPRASQRVALSY